MKLVLKIDIASQVTYLIGGILFLVGSAIILVPQTLIGMYIAGEVLWIVGSSAFLLGAVTRACGLAIEVHEELKRKSLREFFSLRDNLEMLLIINAALTQLGGGVLFVVGACLVVVHPTSTTKPPVLAGEILWVIGASLYVIGLYCKMTAEQIGIAAIRDKSVDGRTHAWLSLQGVNLFFTGSIVFLIGAIAYDVTTIPFFVFGNITWIVGSLLFIVGSILKLIGDLIDQNDE